ncbi:MAG: hypothetical protein PUD92_05345 [Clostridiales bacterium]|nr:hypothetical protein [Clostridiales bacterium]
MARQRRIASHTEVLEFLTDVMRRDIEDGVKLTDAMSAADKLHKYYMQEKDNEKDVRQTGVVILPDIRIEDKKEEDEE